MIKDIRSPGLEQTATSILLFDSAAPKQPYIELKQIDTIVFDPKKEFLFVRIVQGEDHYVLQFKAVNDLNRFIEKLEETIGLPKNSANISDPDGLTKLDLLKDYCSFRVFSETPVYKELLDQ